MSRTLGEQEALRAACDLLAAHPALGLVTGRTLVGPAGRWWVRAASRIR